MGRRRPLEFGPMESTGGARRRPTIVDVAAAAGVSRGTVSRVLNGGHWVSPEAAAAVERAIKETGFQANQYARSLVTGRANSVAFLLTEPQHLLFEDPNFSILLRGAAQALAARGMPLLLMVAGTRDEQQQVLRYVGAGHVDGVLLISSHAGSPVVEALVAQGVPTIACGVPLGHEGAVGYVAADDLGAHSALRYQIAMSKRFTSAASRRAVTSTTVSVAFSASSRIGQDILPTRSVLAENSRAAA